MKKVMVVLSIFAFVGVCYGGIQKNSVEKRLSDVITIVKSRTIETSTQLKTLTQKAKDIVLTWGSDIDANDKTKLQTLNTKIDDATTALDALNTYISTNWDSIQ